jgi:sulfhydrogenase subunit delta
MKPRIGIFGLSGCWGEQIVILNCEDELLALVDAVDITDFLGASSVNDVEGPLAIAFVEGSVGSDREEAALRRIRERASCWSPAAAAPASGAWPPRGRLPASSGWLAEVYGPAAAGYDMRPHRPLHEFVRSMWPSRAARWRRRSSSSAVACLLNGDPPQPAAYPVCAECKMREQDCLLLAAGIPAPARSPGAAARPLPGVQRPLHRLPGTGRRRELRIDEGHPGSEGFTTSRLRTSAEGA